MRAPGGRRERGCGIGGGRFEGGTGAARGSSKSNGDEILKQFSRKLRSQFRYPDVIARWGGDEFVAVLESNISGPELCPRRVCQWTFGEYSIETPEGPRKLRVEGAVGSAEWRPGETTSELLKRADAAMFAQKEPSRGRSARL